MRYGITIDSFLSDLWEDYQCYCIDNHLELLEREEYITTLKEYYIPQVEAKYHSKVYDKEFGIKLGKELFFPLKGREPKTHYHLETLLLPLNSNFRKFYRQPYFEMVRQQYPEHRIIHTAIVFSDILKVKLLASSPKSPIITLPMQVLTSFYEQCSMQVLQFQSEDDALLFFQLLLEWEDFEEEGSYCDVRNYTEIYVAYQYIENKKVILEGKTLTSFYFPGGIDFTEAFQLNFGARSLM